MVSAQALQPLLAGLGKEAVVVIIAEDAEEIRPELLNWIKPGLIREENVTGLELEEADRLIRERLDHSLTSVELQAWQAVIKMVGGHPGVLRALAIEEEAQDRWQVVRDKLQACKMPVEQVRGAIMHRWDRLPTEKQGWLRELLHKMKYGGRFGDVFGRVAWQVSEGDAARQSSQLERAGLVEKVESQLAALGLKESRWRVSPVVYRTLEAGQAIVEHRPTPVSARITLKDMVTLEFAGDSLNLLSKRFEKTLWRIWRGRQIEKFGSLLPSVPWQFVFLMTLWLLPWSLFKLTAGCLLWVVERVVGERGWLRWWLDWTIAFTAEDGLKAHWVQSGLEPSEEFWLLYDAREGWGWIGLISEGATIFLFVLAMSRFISGALEKDMWV